MPSSRGLVNTLGRSAAAAIAICLLIFSLFVVRGSYGASQDDLVFQAREAMERLYGVDFKYEEMIRNSAGALIFPRIVKVAAGPHGEKGDGVLKIGIRYVGRFTVYGGSIGATAGYGHRSLIIVFRNDDILERFLSQETWTIADHADHGLRSIGSPDSIDADTTIVGLVLDEKGLLADVPLQGCKIVTEPEQR